MPPHTHDENELLQKILRPELSQVLLDRERDFNCNHFPTFERCREQTTHYHAYTNRFKLGPHLDNGQKVLCGRHPQALSKNQKLQQRSLGPITVIKPKTSITYQTQDDKGPSIMKTVHCNILVEYYPKEESLPAMIEQYAPHDQRNDVKFFERFLEQRIGKLNGLTEPLTEEPSPFPIRPLLSAPAIFSHKRESVTGSDSGVGSPQVF